MGAGQGAYRRLRLPLEAPSSHAPPVRAPRGVSGRESVMFGRQEVRKSMRVPIAVLAVLALGLAGPGFGIASAAQDAGAPETAPAPVDLDRLLELPPSLDYKLETRGGDTRAEWRSRFEEVRTRLAEERKGLAEAEEELIETAGAAATWQVAPPLPGVSQASADAPLDFQLRRRIDRHRKEIDLLESRLDELEIEANLVGVPEEWRR